MQSRLDELLQMHRDGINLNDVELKELEELHLQALYKVAQQVDDDHKATFLMSMAWSTHQKLQRIKSPVERMNQAGVLMFEKLKELNESIQGVVLPLERIGKELGDNDGSIE